MKCQGHNPLAIRIRISISRIRIKCRVFPLFFAARGNLFVALFAQSSKNSGIFFGKFSWPTLWFSYFEDGSLPLFSWKSTLERTVFPVTFNNSSFPFNCCMESSQVVVLYWVPVNVNPVLWVTHIIFLFHYIIYRNWLSSSLCVSIEFSLG